MTIEELNALVDSGEIDEFIRVCEARQRKTLSRIADDICARKGVRVVLLAGGSSAGKTTTVTRLATQLRVNDARVTTLSTDDFFVGDARNPRDENGELDYEHVECVDIPRLCSDVNRLLAGETIVRRRFDFVRHEGFDSDEKRSLPPGGILLIEGIHALNPRLTDQIDEAVKYRVFIEPKTQLEVFGPVQLTSSDARLVRRIVRDNQFRRLPPEETFRLWPKVLEGERRWIDPFRPNADVEFDSALPYELSILTLYARGLLELCLRRQPDNARAQSLAALLAAVHPSDPSKVPGDSILRETIGGSQLAY